MANFVKKLVMGVGEIVQAVKYAPKHYHEAVGYGMCCEGLPPVRARYAAVKGVASFVKATAVCACVGHKLVGDGWAGPESGGDGAYCERCGYSWHVTYY